jgi:hypothetical protein
VEKCNSCLYDGVKDKKPLKTFDVFSKALKINPSAARVWLSRYEVGYCPRYLNFVYAY